MERCMKCECGIDHKISSERLEEIRNNHCDGADCHGCAMVIDLLQELSATFKAYKTLKEKEIFKTC
jgi:hypothetical protein